jgi:uncharacterized protein (TIGR02147 family)
LDIYNCKTYKEAIKAQLKHLRNNESRKGLTLKKIARLIPIQYTYLSKALSDSKTHLNEDHIFKICNLLEILPEEMEFLQLQRSFEMANDNKRKNYLYSRIESLKKSRNLNAETQAFDSRELTTQMAYLFDPLCILVHAALFIEEFQKDPRALCSKLGTQRPQLAQILKVLDQNGFIELGEEDFEIKKIMKTNFHFGREHPLMRLHQTILKTAIHSQLTRTEEKNKHSFIVTFSMDYKGFERAKDEFQTFLKKIENIASTSKDEQVYQLNFDLFRWL